MRRRINKNAVCSSENYSASKRVHQSALQEAHSSFSLMAVSSKVAEEDKITLGKQFLRAAQLVTINVFGKPLKITKSEYDKHCTDFKMVYA